MNYLFVFLVIPIFSVASFEHLDPTDSSFRHHHRHPHNSLTGAVKKSFVKLVRPHVLVANRIYMIIAKLLIWLRLEPGLHQKRDCLFFIDNGSKRGINASDLARRLSKVYGVAVYEWANVALKGRPEQIVYFGCARVAIYGDACIFATNFWAATKIASEWHKNGFRYTPHAPYLTHKLHSNH